MLRVCHSIQIDGFDIDFGVNEIEDGIDYLIYKLFFHILPVEISGHNALFDNATNKMSYFAIRTSRSTHKF